MASRSTLITGSLRLASFDSLPLELPEGLSLSDRQLLSPMNLARAGFGRESGLASNEVVCFSCRVKVSVRAKTPPMCLHWLLRPGCQFLQLRFKESSTSSIRNSRDPGSKLAVNDDLLLFESQRLLTFTSPQDSVSQAWAREGFVMTRPEDQATVECVFCGERALFAAGAPCSVHMKISPKCPSVRHLDKGNISRKHEEKRRRKCGADLLSEPKSFHRHPQFQGLEKRLQTFRTWPPILEAIVPKQTMAEAGFFFSGCSDRVDCYSCGYRLRHWGPGDDPWNQHALAMPTCLHLSQHPENLQTAANDQIRCVAEPPTEGTLSCWGEVQATSPLLPQLSLEAVQVALESGYTIKVVRQAINSILWAAGGYPNPPLLMGKLQASEANKDQVQRQETLMQQQKDTILHLEDVMKNRIPKMRLKQLQQHKQELEQERHRQRRELEEDHSAWTVADSLQAKMTILNRDVQEYREKLRSALAGASLSDLHSEVERERNTVRALRAALQKERLGNVSRIAREGSNQWRESMTQIFDRIEKQDAELTSSRQELSRSRKELSKWKQELRQARLELSRKDQELSKNRLELSRSKQELHKKDQTTERFVQLVLQQGVQLPILDPERLEKAVPKDDPLPALPPAEPAAPSPLPVPVPAPLQHAPAPPRAAAAASLPARLPRKAEGEELLCKMCVKREARALFLPCSHLLCCVCCAFQFWRQNCPVCRFMVKNWILVFRA